MVEYSMYKTKISAKGQVVIPKELREKYGYKKGVELTLTPLDETRLLMERVPKLSEILGFMGEVEASKTLIEKREAEVLAEGERQVELSKPKGR